MSRGWSQTLLSGASQQHKRQWTGTDAQEVPPEHEEELLQCAVVTHWNKLPREDVEFPSVNVFKRETISCAMCSRMILPREAG